MKYGGLRIVELKLKNRALLNKWIWRYGEKLDVLWRLIITSKYEGEHIVIPNIGKHRRFSRLLKNITRPLCCHDNHFATFLSGIGLSLSSGSKIRFWLDNWTDEVTLKIAFSRIFALAANKQGKVNEFGSWINNRWMWKILLRKRLFGWELQQWNEFCLILNGNVTCDSLKDSLI
ncbi:hypothetical protein CRYUN_Cryun39dG0027400 [Craigia yunnanensis]